MSHFELIERLRNESLYVKYDVKFDEKWSDEELFLHIIELKYSGLELTELPNLPNCQLLECYNNNLEKLPNLPSCINLNCMNNLLKIKKSHLLHHE